MASKRASASSKSTEQIASSGADKGSELPVMTLEEVKKHAADDDCYLAVDGFVCNVTHYLDDHPGSAEQLIGVAGASMRHGFLSAGLPAPSFFGAPRRVGFGVG
jgi:cytochrome b involved in lipid metabolism